MFDDADMFAWLDDQPTPDVEPRDPYVTSAQLETPIVFSKRAAKREFIAGLRKEALTALIPALPPPDVDLWIVSNGAGAETRHGINADVFDFGSFLPVLVGYLGNTNIHAYISTWTCARTHTKTILDMLADGRLKTLFFASDPYFAKREATIFSEFAIGCEKYGDRARILCWKNHCKIFALANEDESRTCVISGSANATSQPRSEQYVLTAAPEVYRFYRDEFFEAMAANAKAKQNA